MLYSKDRVREEVIFNEVRKDVESLTPASRPLCLALDDTIMRKTGKTIPGAAWRWDIEVNHRDEKTILGSGQAQVRNKNSVENIPAMAVAAYAVLHLAAIKAYGPGGKPAVIPEAKWRKPVKKQRPSTQDLINELRRELWSLAIRPEILSEFMNTALGDTKPLQFEPNLCSSLFAATA